MLRWPDTDRDSGSVMIAIFLTMVLSGFAVVLTASMLNEAKTTRHDQQFTAVLPAADSAIARGLFMLNNGLAASMPTCAVTGAAPCTPGSISLSGQNATWFASPLTSTTAPTSYLLTATTQGLTRKLRAEAYQSARFGAAAFANSSIVFRGGNGASSYNSASGNLNSTGHGVLGSNGSVTLNGNATADGVTLWNWTASPNGSRCSGGPCPSYTTVGPALDITSPSATQFISAGLSACSAQTAFTTSNVPSHALPAGTWCASSLNLDVSTTITGPTVIYVSGNVTMGHHLTINYAAGVEPVPANLQIYMLGSTFDMANHTTLAAAVYAPLATCNGGAQSVVYGSLVCGAISNVGGWQFHYDDALGVVGVGDFRLRNYREN